MKIIYNFRQIQSKLLSQLKDDRGATMLEYGFLLAGIGGIMGVCVFMIGEDISGVFENLNGFLEFRNESLFGGGIENPTGESS